MIWLYKRKTELRWMHSSIFFSSSLIMPLPWLIIHSKDIFFEHLLCAGEQANHWARVRHKRLTETLHWETFQYSPLLLNALAASALGFIWELVRNTGTQPQPGSIELESVFKNLYWVRIFIIARKFIHTLMFERHWTTQLFTLSFLFSFTEIIVHERQSELGEDEYIS